MAINGISGGARSAPPTYEASQEATAVGSRAIARVEAIPPAPPMADGIFRIRVINEAPVTGPLQLASELLSLPPETIAQLEPILRRQGIIDVNVDIRSGSGNQAFEYLLPALATHANRAATLREGISVPRAERNLPTANTANAAILPPAPALAQPMVELRGSRRGAPSLGVSQSVTQAVINNPKCIAAVVGSVILATGFTAVGIAGMKSFITPVTMSPFDNCETVYGHMPAARWVCDQILDTQAEVRYKECDRNRFNCQNYHLKQAEKAHSGCGTELYKLRNTHLQKIQQCQTNAQMGLSGSAEIMNAKLQQALKDGKIPVLMQGTPTDMSGGSHPAYGMVNAQGKIVKNYPAQKGLFQMQNRCIVQDDSGRREKDLYGLYGQPLKHCPELNQYEKNVEGSNSRVFTSDNQPCSISVTTEADVQKQIDNHNAALLKLRQTRHAWQEARRKVSTIYYHKYRDATDANKAKYKAEWQAALDAKNQVESALDAAAKALKDSPLPYCSTAPYTGISFYKNEDQRPQVIHMTQKGQLLMASDGGQRGSAHLIVGTQSTTYAEYIAGLKQFVADMVHTCRAEISTPAEQVKCIKRNADTIIQAFTTPYLEAAGLANLILIIKKTVHALEPSLYPKTVKKTHSTKAPPTTNPVPKFSSDPPPEEVGRFDWEQFGVFSLAGVAGVFFAFIGGWYMGTHSTLKHVRRHCTDDEYQRLIGQTTQLQSDYTAVLTEETNRDNQDNNTSAFPPIRTSASQTENESPIEEAIEMQPLNTPAPVLVGELGRQQDSSNRTREQRGRARLNFI